jgi:hypothetical protein
MGQTCRLIWNTKYISIKYLNNLVILGVRFLFYVIPGAREVERKVTVPMGMDKKGGKRRTVKGIKTCQLRM